MAVPSPQAAGADASPPETGRYGACRNELPEETPALDVMRAGLERGVCSTVRFVDSLFGGEYESSELEDENYGRAGLALDWNELDRWDLDGHFRASVELPALSERVNATIGRASRDDYVAGEAARVAPVASSFSDDEPAEWFAGLGYRVHRDRDSRFDLGAGVKLQSPLNPYVNARYRHYLYGRPGRLTTLRSTVFWENDEGFGVTQSLGFDRVLGRDYLLRYGNSARLSEETLGVRWQTRLSLYQAIDYRRAMRYDVSMRGETDGTQPDLYGLRVTHRRSVLREWLFAELGAALFWADGPMPDDRCDACIGVSIGFEVLFGEAYDRALHRDRRAQGAAEATP